MYTYKFVPPTLTPVFEDSFCKAPLLDTSTVGGVNVVRVDEHGHKSLLCVDLWAMTTQELFVWKRNSFFKIREKKKNGEVKTKEEMDTEQEQQLQICAPVLMLFLKRDLEHPEDLALKWPPSVVDVRHLESHYQENHTMDKHEAIQMIHQRKQFKVPGDDHWLQLTHYQGKRIVMILKGTGKGTRAYHPSSGTVTKMGVRTGPVDDTIHAWPDLLEWRYDTDLVYKPSWLEVGPYWIEDAVQQTVFDQGTHAIVRKPMYYCRYINDGTSRKPGYHPINTANPYLAMHLLWKYVWKDIHKNVQRNM